MSEVKLILGDCLEMMKDIPDKSVDAVITDPPYGCGKADWDDMFPVEWYTKAKIIADMVVIITGSSGLKDSIPLVGEDFIDVISAWNNNGMTRSPIGYGNWLAAVIACKKPRMGQNFYQFSVSKEKPNHPSPKPIEYMKKLVYRISEKDDTILDPFMGSGTTGVACVQTGRNFIGIEIDPTYFAIAEKRIKDAQQQMRLPL